MSRETLAGADFSEAGWLPHRGDYGAEYAYDLIARVEATSCRFGCAKAGTDAEVAEFGPGGTCAVLMNLSIAAERVPIWPKTDGPCCMVREAL